MRTKQRQPVQPGARRDGAAGTLTIQAGDAPNCNIERLPRGQVLVGDALERLKRLPSGSVDTVITSPPYFLLRDYHVAGQIGLEPHVEVWVERLRAVFGEIARVLKPEGTLWLNLGDTYSRGARFGAPAKGLVLAPERLLLALAADGWTVRNKIVWAKPNAMPSSVTDRMSASHEPLYLLVRSKGYFFDLDAIRVRSEPKGCQREAVGSGARCKDVRWSRVGRGKRRLVANASKHPAGRDERAAERRVDKYATDGARGAWAGPLAGNNSGLRAMKAEGRSTHALGKNPGDVWTIATATFRGAHFACFPPKLIEKPVLAGCPEKVCAGCGRAWRRARAATRIGQVAVLGALQQGCECGPVGTLPGVVLDPFIGAGTVGLVAERLGRDWIGIELKREYAVMATERIVRERTTEAREKHTERPDPGSEIRQLINEIPDAKGTKGTSGTRRNDKNEQRR